jgi:hypothetical protein
MFISGHNVVLYNQLVSRMADVVRERIAANKKAEVSGRVNVEEWRMAVNVGKENQNLG